ncbi:hypothetical protein ALC62_15880, partial [Cyphomyrmex costatus]
PRLLQIVQRDEGRSLLWNIGASSQGSHADEALARKPRGQAPQLLQLPSGSNSLPQYNPGHRVRTFMISLSSRQLKNKEDNEVYGSAP